MCGDCIIPESAPLIHGMTKASGGGTLVATLLPGEVLIKIEGSICFLLGLWRISRSSRDTKTCDLKCHFPR